MTTSSQSIRDRHVRSRIEDDRAAQEYADSYSGWGPGARFFHSRLHAVLELLRSIPGGALLDVGCGPGELVSRILCQRPGDFRIDAVDLSPGMIRAADAKIGNVHAVQLRVDRAEALPYADESFDVVTAMGVLEYTDAPRALAEIARVTRGRGVVMLSMLNPRSPYRLFEWRVFSPLVRLRDGVRRLMGRQRPPFVPSGIRAFPQGRLSAMMRTHGLRADDVLYFDRNLLLPPLDRVIRRWTQGWRDKPTSTVGRGRLSRLTGTAYIVVAHRDEQGARDRADEPSVSPLPSRC
jgi:ubiquinone/menaquinone biosynthesis C-methylase UbiE